MAVEKASKQSQVNDFLAGKQNDPRDTGANVFLNQQQIDTKAGVFLSGPPMDKTAEVFFGGIPLHESAKDFLS